MKREVADHKISDDGFFPPRKSVKIEKVYRIPRWLLGL